LLPLFALVAFCNPAQADWSPDLFVFATQEQGAALLGTSDDYSAHLTPLDRAMRLRTDGAVSEEEFLSHAAKSAVGWDDAEQKALRSDITKIVGTLNALHVPAPKDVLLIKTDGKEEGDAGYTRSDAIMLPQILVNGSKDDLLWLLAHELFHVVSRQNPALREQLYATIGFNKVEPFALPADITARLVTNPDAFTNDHFVQVTVDDEDVCATPLLMFTTDKYDMLKGGPFFNYMQVRFVVSRHIAARKDGVPEDLRLVTKNRIYGFLQKVGENTGYLIHPEEILADNFALMVTGLQRPLTPEIIEKMRAAFAHAADPAAPAPDAPMPCP
jgi:hypothetical protein